MRLKISELLHVKEQQGREKSPVNAELLSVPVIVESSVEHWCSLTAAAGEKMGPLSIVERESK